MLKTPQKIRDSIDRYRKTERGKETNNKASKKWRLKHPSHHKNLRKMAKKRGLCTYCLKRLVKTNRTICEVCSNKIKERYHENNIKIREEQ